MPAHRHLVLMGSMGSGKTTVGRLAAAQLDRPFFDSDDDLASMFGATASEIEDRHGIEQLHEVEADLLHRRLCASEPSVIAAAASTIEVPRCRRLLRSRAQVAWLYVEPDVVARRIAASSWRPLVHDRSEEELAAELLASMRSRAPALAEVASRIVDATALDADATVAAVLADRRRAGAC